MKKTILIVSLTLLSICVFGQENVSGYVFEDLNGNNRKDKNEKGIADVAVSNGINVVKTDQSGKYTLDLVEDQMIFVIKPSGYEIPTDQNNLPLFYYNHKPSGSPKELKYKGVDATGKLPKSVDFALKSGKQADEQFRILVFGDPQPYNLKEVEYFSKGAVSEVEGIENVSFGIALGDLVGDDLSLYPDYIKAIQKIGKPWYSVMGNHDQNYDVEEDKLTDETFESYFGPATYAFNHGKVHFIVLENILYPDPRDGQGYWGGLREDQLTFVENNLKLVPKDHLVVVFMHIPIFEELGDSFRDEDRTKLLELLSPFANSVSLSAHTHYMRQTFWGKEEGFTGSRPHHHFNIGTPSGDWYSGKMTDNGLPQSTMRDGSPNGYVFMEFDRNNYTTSYKAAGKPETYQIEVFAPKMVRNGQRTTASIVANFFIGAKTDTLKYRIGQGEWKNMVNFEGMDPTYLLEVYKWDTADSLPEGRRPSNPYPTDHLWRAAVPTDLPTGEHSIEIEAIDMFGKKHYTTRTITVIE
jgi:hypothetical protein